MRTQPIAAIVVYGLLFFIIIVIIPIALFTIYLSHYLIVWQRRGGTVLPFLQALTSSAHSASVILFKDCDTQEASALVKPPQSLPASLAGMALATHLKLPSFCNSEQFLQIF